MVQEFKEHKIAVVMPCYKSKAHVLEVIEHIPEYVEHIICVDDFCPENTGKFIEKNCDDGRVQVFYHEKNLGVGGAMVTGYKVCLDADSNIIVKIDSDGQMDPNILHRFVRPIIEKQADYTKGNRFFQLEGLGSMPKIRLLGNASLSFLSKLSTGYWQMFDPNNGYLAIHRKVLNLLPLDKIDKGYFFESDMLFRLNTIRSVVMDIPITSIYKDEISNIKIEREFFNFGLKHIKNFLKRIFYNYFLRDFSVASIEWVLGPSLIMFGVYVGIDKWIESYQLGVSATAGTVMLAALPIIMGLQLLLSALNYDIYNQPANSLQLILNGDEQSGA